MRTPTRRIFAGWNMYEENGRIKLIFETDDKQLLETVQAVCTLATDLALAENRLFEAAQNNER